MPQQNVTVFVANLPPYSIIMWYGDANAVPDGWQLCNGAAGTPDLRDRFPVGAGISYLKGASGGEAAHTLTISEIPSHTHTVNYSGTWGVEYAGSYTDCPRSGQSATGAAGGGFAHNNIPPYLAVYYIMRMP